MFDLTQPIYSRSDGSFVITYNGMPYHLTQDDPHKPEGLWEAVMEYIEENPGVVQPEPEPEPPTQEQLNDQRIAEIVGRLTEIDQASIRPLRALAEGTAGDKDRVKLMELESKAVELRDELNSIGGA